MRLLSDVQSFPRSACSLAGAEAAPKTGARFPSPRTSAAAPATRMLKSSTSLQDLQLQGERLNPSTALHDDPRHARHCLSPTASAPRAGSDAGPYGARHGGDRPQWRSGAEVVNSLADELFLLQTMATTAPWSRPTSRKTLQNQPWRR